METFATSTAEVGLPRFADSALVKIVGFEVSLRGVPHSKDRYYAGFHGEDYPVGRSFADAKQQLP
ncbi:MAG: hypothetical protein WD738_16950 [Pirellulales bacterium]